DLPHHHAAWRAAVHRRGIAPRRGARAHQHGGGRALHRGQGTGRTPFGLWQHLPNGAVLRRRAHVRRNRRDRHAGAARSGAAHEQLPLQSFLRARMAQIVSVIASTHTPRICWNRDQANKDDLAYLFQSFGELRTRLARTKPDVIVAIANDHLDNFFFDNMPAFTVCTGPMAEGPFWYEAEIMHLPAYKARIDQDFAGYLLRRGIERGI